MKKINVRKLTLTAMLVAVSSVLMFFSFNVPLMPGYIKMDFSELPALIAAFSMGPVAGVAVCFLKNLINLSFTTTGGIGELANFIIGTLFVFPAGLIYAKMKTKKGAFIGSITGLLCMAIGSVFINYYIVYPTYMKLFYMTTDIILKSYNVILIKLKLDQIDNLWKALIYFNMPFTFIKGLCSVVITLLVYKKISKIINKKGLK